MNDPRTPNDALDPQDEGALIDLHLGQLDAADEEALRARLAREPALRDEGEALAAFFRAEQAVFAGGADAGAAARMAARIRLQEQARTPARAVARPNRWARVLAISIGVHVAALALLAFWIGRQDDDTGDATGGVAARWVESDDAGAPDAVSTTAEWVQDVARTAPIQIPDAVLLGAAEAPRDDGYEHDLSDWEPAEPTRARKPLEHPREVAVSMWIRREPALKSRRLTLLGFEADGTLRAVRRGLRWLSLRQRADGSFEAPDGGSALEQTAVALLPFLGDGHDSTNPSEGPDARQIAVVRDGIAWIRAHAFKDGRVVDASAATLGAVTMALCEDYMLGYGRLRLTEARERAREISGLTEALRSRGGTAAPATDAPWALWGLDAALRTGVVSAQADESARFRDWVAMASTPGPARALHALSTGTAVLLADASPDKAGFRAWSGAHAEDLLASLLPNGRVRSDSDDVGAVGETARSLLALQIAYRTY